VGLGQVLVVGAFALDQIGNGVEPQPVDARVEPEAHDPENFLQDARIVEIEVGLVRIEPVPEKAPATGSHVQLDFSVSRKMMRVSVFLVGVGPDVEVARRAIPGRACRARWNQGCWSDVWLITSSVMTRNPRSCASRTKRRKSLIVP
jgi:hypothetical protein